MENSACNVKPLHEPLVKIIKKNMDSDENITILSEYFKMFCDPTRLKIIEALLISEMCVCDMANAINLNQSTLSHQIQTLKYMGILKYRKDGKIIYYSIKDESIKEILKITRNKIIK